MRLFLGKRLGHAITNKKGNVDFCVYLMDFGRGVVAYMNKILIDDP